MNLPKYRETQRRLFYPCPLPHVSLSVYISNLPLSFLTNLQGSTEVWFVTPYGHIAKIKNKCVKKCKHKNTIRINGITTPTRPNRGLIITPTRPNKGLIPLKIWKNTYKNHTKMKHITNSTHPSLRTKNCLFPHKKSFKKLLENKMNALVARKNE